MVEVYPIVGFLIGISIISSCLLKLRRQTISQGTFALWVIIGVVFVLVSSVPILIFTIQQFIGTEYTLSTIFGIAVSFLMIIVFFLHQKVDILNQRITKLVAALASNEYSNQKDKDQGIDKSK